METVFQEAKPGGPPPGECLRCGNCTRLPSDLLEVFSRAQPSLMSPNTFVPKPCNGTSPRDHPAAHLGPEGTAWWEKGLCSSQHLPSKCAHRVNSEMPLTFWHVGKGLSANTAILHCSQPCSLFLGFSPHRAASSNHPTARLLEPRVQHRGQAEDRCSFLVLVSPMAGRPTLNLRPYQLLF